MALMTWSDKYSVGVKAIDAQHSTLVASLNELHDAMMKGQAQNVVGPLLQKLVKYTVDHFASEEAMMKTAKYPDLVAHHAKHVELTKQVSDFVGRYEKGEIALNMQLMNFLRDWLTTHILKEDKDYGPWLNKSGIR
jgi:hemerythrin-like metal-binding protein